ncbi:unnamed protein product [Urochloa decumbens]|uniref:Uncharacterized protein n=1 Tax=Urochloa decumbens TaxID=240449 RepID=A0ABC8ZS51_9POAL
MEKVSTRLAVVVLCLLMAAAAAPQAADAVEYIKYPKNMISCKALGNCEKNDGGPDATRPGAVANKYTRGCSRIDRCRD